MSSLRGRVVKRLLQARQLTRSVAADEATPPPFDAPNQLGERLLKIRKDAGSGVSQERFAKLMDDHLAGEPALDQPMISRYERGEREPKPEYLEAYAKVAGIELSELTKLRSSADCLHVASRPLRFPLVPSIALLLLAALLVIWFLTQQQAGAHQLEAIYEVGSTKPLRLVRGDHVLWQYEADRPSIMHVPPLMTDLDGDGSKEIVASFDPLTPEDAPGRIVALSSTKDLRWAESFGGVAAMGTRVFGNHYFTHWLKRFKTESSDFIVAVLAHQPHFPSLVLIIDPTSGQLIGDYLHPGRIEALYLTDLNLNGRDELLLGGINNPGQGPGRPSLAIFELPFVQATEPDAIFGRLQLRETQYFLFPRNDLFDLSMSVPAVKGIRRGGVGQYSFDINDPEGRAISWTLDRWLRPLGVYPSDTFSMAHNEKLDHLLGQEEIDSWLPIDRFERAPNANWNLGGQDR